MWWILERTHHPRFLYRLRIEGAGETVLSLHVQEKWPGPRGQVFCPRGDREERFGVSDEHVVERVPVVSLKRYGKRLAVVLDRSKNKRCDFLFLTKKYKPKLIHPYRPSFTTKAVAELSALHPRLQIIFAHNRKLANEWAQWFFQRFVPMRLRTIPP